MPELLSCPPVICPPPRLAARRVPGEGRGVGTVYLLVRSRRFMSHAAAYSDVLLMVINSRKVLPLSLPLRSPQSRGDLIERKRPRGRSVISTTPSDLRPFVRMNIAFVLQRA